MKYPVWEVLAWIEAPNSANGYDLTELDMFDNEADAVKRYRRTRITRRIREVIVQKVTEDDCDDILQKDETGEILNRL